MQDSTLTLAWVGSVTAPMIQNDTLPRPPSTLPKFRCKLKYRRERALGRITATTPRRNVHRTPKSRSTRIPRCIRHDLRGRALSLFASHRPENSILGAHGFWTGLHLWRDARPRFAKGRWREREQIARGWCEAAAGCFVCGSRVRRMPGRSAERRASAQMSAPRDTDLEGRCRHDMLIH